MAATALAPAASAGPVPLRVQRGATVVIHGITGGTAADSHRATGRFFVATRAAGSHTWRLLRVVRTDTQGRYRFTFKATARGVFTLRFWTPDRLKHTYVIRIG